ncbi:MAG: methyltransferase domain-containing protein [Pasteurellaceae bacterium]|nr:methyltransferase domain-containing protein [Pasteurellaceae bacterium]
MKRETLNEIDFAQLYRNHFQLANRQPKQPQDWDQKALKMQTSEFDLNNDYVQSFVSRMTLSPNDTLLDVGCGGGAISLATADKIQHVFALDYSQGMLDLLQRRMDQRAIHNITPILKNWESDWADVPKCDIAVSSRSSMVGDLQQALNKLNAKARKAVYMTMTVDHQWDYAEIMYVIGRTGLNFPSYIYALNLLYQQGYLVNVDFIPRNNILSTKPLSVDELLKSVQYRVGSTLTNNEVQKLQAYYQQNQQDLAEQQAYWAFLHWKK